MLPAKHKGSSRQKGFTLVEILIAVCVIAILIAIAIPAYMGYADKAKTAVLKTNKAIFFDMVYIYSIDYDKSDWYDSWNHNGDDSLNNYIEQELEIIIDGTCENDINLINPYSGKKSILDYNGTLSSGDGYCPAVFLTANNAYAYGGTGSTKNIIGTIVAYFKVGASTTEYIEIYYVNKDGTKSDDCMKIN